MPVDAVFQHCPLLQPLHSELPRLMKAFNDYRWSVPVCGCIMLNDAMDKVLLVKGWSEWSNWTFPKGKIARDEEKLPCAVREVVEETSYDCGPLVNGEDFIDLKINGKQDVRLYIAHGVQMDFPFAPHTKGEISKIEWVKIKELKELKEGKGVKPGKFDVTKTYAVTPFIPKLKGWIKANLSKAAGATGEAPTGAVRAGAYDVSALEQQLEAAPTPPGVMDVAELERRQSAGSSGGGVVAGAFDVSALEGGGAISAVDVGALESQWAANDQGAGEALPEERALSPRSRDQETFGTNQGLTNNDRNELFEQYSAIAEKERDRPIVTAAQIGGSAGATGARGTQGSAASEKRDGKKDKRDKKEKKAKAGKGDGGVSAQAAAVAAVAEKNTSEKKGRKRGKGGRGKAAPEPAPAPVIKVLQRPIKTAAQLGGAAAVAAGGGVGGAADAAAATWQQRDGAAATGNPFLDWRLPAGIEKTILGA